MDRRSFLTLLPAALDAQTAGTPALESGFVSLFDGRTLRGWQIREGPESAFYVKEGAITVHEGANFPAWLRSEKQYENFDFRCEFFLKGWMNSGLFLHAPEHGRNTWIGLKINLFHKQDQKMLPESAGSIFPLVPPLRVNVKNQGEWNELRALMDWPRLQVWINGELVQAIDLQSVPELRYRLRRGYLGIESLSYPIRFRNLRIRELPAKDHWQALYEKPEDLAKWEIVEGKARWDALGEVLRADGLGHLATVDGFRDFELHTYIRASRYSNGGILFRAEGQGNRGRHYEIQLHDVEGAVYPTGSLYGFKRAIYPKIEPEKWFLFQLIVNGPHCIVRINGENVVEYGEMENLDAGRIMLQAHETGRWIEYKQIRVKRIGTGKA
ncbi:MAG: 3-keto-disaccharide hydrolase [Bryobacteraceae bacterium]